MKNDNNNVVCCPLPLNPGDIEIYISLEGRPNSLMQVLKVPGSSRIQIVAPNALLISYQVGMPVAVGDRAISISQTD